MGLDPSDGVDGTLLGTVITTTSVASLLLAALACLLLKAGRLAWVRRASPTLLACGAALMTDPEPTSRPAQRKAVIASRALLPCLAVLAGSSALAVPSGLASVGLLPEPALPEGVAQLSGVALSAALVLYCTVWARRLDLATFFRLLYPLAALGLLLASTPDVRAAFVGECLLYAAQWALYVFVWLFALEGSGDALRACLAYALVRAAFELGFLVARLAVPTLVASGVSVVHVCFGAIVLFVLTVTVPLDRTTRDEIPAGEAAGEHAPSADDRRVADVAGRYALSPRETQILALLLRGYSLAAIRNELYIAKGTVDTYVQRIYRKCDVHSRQGLVDIADARTHME